MIVISPNKKMAWVVLVLSLPLAGYGFYLVAYEPTSRWKVYDIFEIPDWILGTILILSFFSLLGTLIWVYQTNERIVLDRRGIILSNRKRIGWHQVEEVKVLSYKFIDVFAKIYLKDGQEIGIRWIHLNCGVRKFTEMVLFYLRNPERREALGDFILDSQSV